VFVGRAPSPAAFVFVFVSARVISRSARHCYKTNFKNGNLSFNNGGPQLQQRQPQLQQRRARAPAPHLLRDNLKIPLQISDEV